MTGSKQNTLARRAVFWKKYLPETRMSGIFEAEMPRKIPSTKKYFLNWFVPQNLLLDLFEWAEKPKWKWMAEEILYSC